MVKLGVHEKGEGVGLLGIITLVVLVIVLVVGGYLAYRHFHDKSNIVKDNVSSTVVSQTSASQTNTSKTNSSATNQSQTASTSTQNPTTSTAVESSSGQSTIKFAQLGVEITVPNSIDDLIYYASTTKTTPAATTAVMSTTTLAKLDPACGVDSTKTTASLEGIGELYEYAGTYNASNNPNKTSVWSKQFPSFYVAYDSPASACSKTASTNTIQNTQVTTLKSALSTMKVTAQ